MSENTKLIIALIIVVGYTVIDKVFISKSTGFSIQTTLIGGAIAVVVYIILSLISNKKK